MIINIQGTGLELTEALKLYATEKIDGLQKFFDNITQADIDIGSRTNHHQKGPFYYCDVNLHIPGSPMLRVERDSDDLYKAIDKVKDHLKVELQDLKQKKRLKDKGLIRGNKEYTA